VPTARPSSGKDDEPEVVPRFSAPSRQSAGQPDSRGSRGSQTVEQPDCSCGAAWQLDLGQWSIRGAIRQLNQSASQRKTQRTARWAVGGWPARLGGQPNGHPSRPPDREPSQRASDERVDYPVDSRASRRRTRDNRRSIQPATQENPAHGSTANPRTTTWQTTQQAIQLGTQLGTRLTSQRRTRGLPSRQSGGEDGVEPEATRRSIQPDSPADNQPATQQTPATVRQPTRGQPGGQASGQPGWEPSPMNQRRTRRQRSGPPGGRQVGRRQTRVQPRLNPADYRRTAQQATSPRASGQPDKQPACGSAGNPRTTW
jgi:hypothetical protein